MKNLKTILTLLVFTVITFSFQKKDELIELKNLNEFEKSFNCEGVKTPTNDRVVEVYADYFIANGGSRDLLRNYYSSFFNLYSYKDSDCLTESDTEIWTIQKITEKEFYDIVRTIPVLGQGGGTEVLGTTEDDDPVGNPGRIFLRYRDTCGTKN